MSPPGGPKGEIPECAARRSSSDHPMNINDITAALRADAVWVVFANVLLQQLGLPLPAIPTLLLAGSLAVSYGQAGELLAAAVAASVIADLLWYSAGRAFGSSSTIEERKTFPGLDPRRADIILGGAILLSQALAHLGSLTVEVSTRGLRWGLLYDRFLEPQHNS